MLAKGGRGVASVVLFGLTLAPAPASAAGVELSSSQGAYDLSRAIEVLQDPGGSLTLEEVSAVAPGDFAPPSTSALQLTGGEVTWVRLRLQPADAAAARIPWLLEGPGGLVQRADAALYRAKHLGKNRVERAETFSPKL